MSIVKEFNLLLRRTRGSATFRRLANELASPASERGSADQRGKLWARES